MSYKSGVLKAITALKGRGGSSLQAIKNQLGVSAPGQIKQVNAALKAGVKDGTLRWTKGKYSVAKKAAPPKKKKQAPKKKPAAKKAAKKKPAKKAPKKKAPKKKARKLAGGLMSSALGVRR